MQVTDDRHGRIKGVVVSGVPFEATPEALHRALEEVCGPVRSVELKRNPDGRPKGRALVEFVEEEGAAAAAPVGG